jgi:hypothetical protein
MSRPREWVFFAVTKLDSFAPDSVQSRTLGRYLGITRNIKELLEWERCPNYLANTTRSIYSVADNAEGDFPMSGAPVLIAPVSRQRGLNILFEFCFGPGENWNGLR